MILAMKACTNCGEPTSGKRRRCGRCSPGRPRSGGLPTAPTRSAIDVDRAIELRDSGHSLSQIGEIFGVTRQCVSRTLRVYEARRAGEQARFRPVEDA